jgi:hypothetical protein
MTNSADQSTYQPWGPATVPAPPPQRVWPPPPPPSLYLRHTSEPPQSDRLKKRHRWPWAVLAALVVVVGATAIVNRGATDGATDSAGGGAPAPTALGVGGTGTTSGLQVTLLQDADPWTPTNAFEQPATGRRFVGVELDVVNVSGEQQVLSTLMGLDIVDSVGQHWNIALAGLDLPTLDATLQANERRRGWAIFEVPVESTGLQLSVKGALTASGIDFQL